MQLNMHVTVGKPNKPLTDVLMLVTLKNFAKEKNFIQKKNNTNVSELKRFGKK